MSSPLQPTPALLCKLASVVVHSDEMLSADGHPFDRNALLSLIRDDAEVKEWILQMTDMGMAPVKRTGKRGAR